MKKFTPLNKQTKKTQKEYYASMRGSWDGVKPCARIFPDKTKFVKAQRSRGKSMLRNFSV